jgi:hypothetical protein
MLKSMSGIATMWLGITGASITLFAGLLTPLDMADWAWWLVQNWQDVTPLVWDRVAAWLGTEMPSVLVPPLTMTMFLVATAVGVGMRARRHQAPIAVDYPTLQLGAAMAALLAMGYFLLLHPASASAASSVPSEAPLAIFLAGAAVSFSPMAADRGNLTIKLWFVLLGTGILLAVNELTKLAM